jgi:hypothetical protein
MPTAITASRRARVSPFDDFRTIQALAPVSRIAHFLFNFPQIADLRRKLRNRKTTFSFKGPYQP